MIQFNLLPDVKLEFMRAQRTKRTVIAISSLVSGVAVVIVVLLVVATFGFQAKHLNDLTADIKKNTNNLSSTDSVNKILTVQNQLASLPALHDKEQDTTRIFPYIEKLTPTNVSISSLDIDFDAMTMKITGAVDSSVATNKLAAVNTFVDTLKFTTYNNQDGKATKAFTGVVLSSSSRSDKGANYTIDLTFDPAIFATANNTNLTVPNLITTRSEIEKPTTNLFVPSQTDTTEKQ